MGKNWSIFIILILCIPFVNATGNETNTEIYELEAMAIALTQGDGNVLDVELLVDNQTNTTVYEVRVQSLDGDSTRYTIIDANTGVILRNYDEINFRETEEYLKPQQFFFLEQGRLPFEEDVSVEQNNNNVRVPIQPSRWNIFRAWISNLFN